MKNKFIYYIIGIASLCLNPCKILAADLVVAAGGAGGAYSSINTALAAANPNDRIIVYPQPGGASFSETAITITKSVQILSANEGAYYSVDAPSINISPSTPGIVVTIIGMKFFTGSIASTINSPTGSRSVINFLNDSIAQGSISINHDNYDVTTASCHIQSGITIRYGKIIGNIILSQVAINTDGSVNNPNDTIQIIGNKITYYSAVATSPAISWSSTAHFFSIQNNFMTLTYPTNINGVGIGVTTSKFSLAGTNNITNNTVTKAYYTIYYGMSCTTSATSKTDINNNLVLGPIYFGDYYVTGGVFSVHYNFASANAFVGFTNDGTNINASNTTLDVNGLNTNPASNTINGGNPDSAFADINLTRNDVGCYGGSFTLDNFFPITSNDWARVILVTAPRRVLVNGTISVKAIGFDK